MSREEEIKYMETCIDNFEKFCNDRRSLYLTNACEGCKYQNLCDNGSTSHAYSTVLYDNGCYKVADVIKEIRRRLSDVECPVAESTFSYALKLDAEFDKIFAEYNIGVDE